MGVGNILSGFLGGMGGNAMIGLSTIACLNGGRGRVAPVTTALGIIIIVGAAYSVLNYIPLAALAGIMIVVVLHTFKWFSLPMILAALVPKDKRNACGKWSACGGIHRKVIRSDVLVMLGVSILVVLTNIVLAVGIGLGLSAAAFAWEASKQQQITSFITTTTSPRRYRPSKPADTKPNGLNGDGVVGDHQAGGEQQGAAASKDGTRLVKRYEVRGPLFFAATHRFSEYFSPEDDPDDVIVTFTTGTIFDYTMMDALVALTAAYNAEGKSQIAWQTSWGLTTRTLGVMIMVHGDDTGLVLPPRIAPLQAVIVPIVSKKMTIVDVTPYCKEILQSLLDVGIRAKFDDRDTYNPGWKYNHWEQKGVPVRIEVGPRDIEAKQARMVVRSTGDKTDHATADLAQVVKDRLAFIQTDMLERARAVRDSHLVRVTEWKDFVPEIEKHNLVLTPWCGGEHQDWEEWVKEKSREESLAARGEEGEDERTATSVAAKTLCIPFKQPDLPEGTKCFASGLPAKCWVLWGRSY